MFVPLSPLLSLNVCVLIVSSIPNTELGNSAIVVSAKFREYENTRGMDSYEFLSRSILQPQFASSNNLTAFYL